MVIVQSAFHLYIDSGYYWSNWQAVRVFILNPLLVQHSAPDDW